MYGGVSVLECYDIVEGRVIRERIRIRGNTPEMFFLLNDHERVLLVYRGGTAVIPWGARRGEQGATGYAPGASGGPRRGAPRSAVAGTHSHPSLPGVR
jgi:hypothetical protein